MKSKLISLVLFGFAGISLAGPAEAAASRVTPLALNLGTAVPSNRVGHAL